MAQKNTLLICVLVAVLSTVYCSKTKSSKECKESRWMSNNSKIMI